MSPVRKPGHIASWVGAGLLLCLLQLAGCSHPVGLQGDGGGQPDPHPMPFREGEASALSTGGSPSASPIMDTSAKAGGILPFHAQQSLPAGTLLTVRLREAISSGHVLFGQGPSDSAGYTFEAVLDEPVVVDGNTIVPSGSAVSGRVESAGVSQVKTNRGYLRLALDSIEIAGQEMRLQTSSLFTRGSAHLIEAADGNLATSIVTLEKGRRLTFKLTEPVPIVVQRAISSR